MKNTVEAKLGKRTPREEDGNLEESSSDEEDEDENGELATEALDTEIQATLNAIRTKDPRVYDKNVTFYTNEEREEGAVKGERKKDKPMFLRDYHRANLLNGIVDPVEEEREDRETHPRTFAEEQEDLKKNVIREMHHATADDDNDDDDDDDNFLIRKPSTTGGESKEEEAVELDIENADKDPETFLSNFMSSRAWVQKDRDELHPFESDDDEEDTRAEAFEEAYNFRFEDPNKVNEMLVSHARDASNKYSVRREEKSSRKKHRETERSRKDEEKKQRETEKKRLHKLKADELHDKVRRIKEVSGSTKFTDEDWAHLLDDAFDDEKWEAEMQNRFSNEYYEEREERDEGGKGPKKPKWDDDIDITDLVPDFDERQELSDNDDDGDDRTKKKKSKAREKKEQKRDSRKERLRVEEAVDRNLDLDLHLLPGATKKNRSQFRYRETSPKSFGLTAHDILMADDSQLNQFAGLKKLASFRDPEKKRGDQKKFGKKARLRKWRQETFGAEDVTKFSWPTVSAPESDASKVDIVKGEGKKRKRSKRH